MCQILTVYHITMQKPSLNSLLHPKLFGTVCTILMVGAVPREISKEGFSIHLNLITLFPTRCRVKVEDLSPKELLMYKVRHCKIVKMPGNCRSKAQFFFNSSPFTESENLSQSLCSGIHTHEPSLLPKKARCT